MDLLLETRISISPMILFHRRATLSNKTHMNTEHEPLKGKTIDYCPSIFDHLYPPMWTAGLLQYLEVPCLATNFITFLSMFSCYYRNQTSIGSWLSGSKDISKGHMLQFQPPPWWTILIQLSAWEDLSYETRWGGLKSLWGSTFPEGILSSKFQSPFFNMFQLQVSLR